MYKNIGIVLIPQNKDIIYDYSLSLRKLYPLGL